MFLFIVTQYGCNSTPSDMWIPTTKIFTDYEAAYAHYKSVCPDVTAAGKDTIYVNERYDPTSASYKYIVIENRCQSHHWKRPEGALIARYGI